MTQILVGTASWTDKSLVETGFFYPEDAKSPADRLRFYASQFPLVEVDSSYYALPTLRNTILWAQRTPTQFVFDVKAFRLFTQHQTDLRVLPKDIRQSLGSSAKTTLFYRDVPTELREELWLRFVLAVTPLHQAGKLGVLLFQFPPWFFPSQASYQHILECIERLPGFRLAVEFRNRAWFEGDHPERIWHFEREHNLAHVVVDEPQGFSSSIPALWEVTCADVAVVRLHGRNCDTWEAKGLRSSAERFKYLYAAQELDGSAANVRELSLHVKSVHVLFNNNFADYAQRNAAAFRQLI
jgi:uncharacterized protein YecE (DUF72 family)